MLLSALSDFPDDALHVFHEETMHKMMARLKKAGVTRVYMQYYGNRDYGYFWDHHAPSHRNTVVTANHIPSSAGYSSRQPRPMDWNRPRSCDRRNRASG